MRIIQAVMEKPQYLILDEPFDALDKNSKLVASDLLNEYINESRTLIFTSHNDSVESFAYLVYQIEDKNIKVLNS